MKTPCDIIRDLLPLYAEDMTSQASNDLVEEHLGECESCKNYLEELRKPAVSSQNIEVKSLQKITLSIQKQTILTAVTALFLVASILTGLAAWLFHPIWLDADEAILNVKEVDYGGLELTVPSYVTHNMRHSTPNGLAYAFLTNHRAKITDSWIKAFHSESDHTKIEDIHALMEMPDGGFMPYHPELAKKYGVMHNMTDESHWYWNVYEGKIAQTLWDAGYPAPDNSVFESATCITKQIFWTAVGVSVVFLLIAVLSKDSKLKNAASVIVLLAGSHVLAALLMTDGHFFSVRWVADPYPIRLWIWMLTALFAVTALLVRMQYRAKKKIRKVALPAISVILALVLSGIVGVSIFYNSMLNKISRVQLAEKTTTENFLQETAVTPDETEDGIVNILVVGKSALSAGNPQTADTTLLLTINKNTKTVTLHSVLQSTLVKCPAYRGENGGQCKFGAAYANACEKWDVSGAMEVMNLLMEQNFGAAIDYNIEVDAQMFPRLIDAVGGVEVVLSEAEAEYLSKALERKIGPGSYVLDGIGAQSYARMRLTDDGGMRASRQQYLADQVMDLLNQMLQTNGLSAMEKLCSATLPYLTTNMENAQITKLMVELISMWPELKVESTTIPAPRTYKGELMDITGNGSMESVIVFDESQNKELIRAITEGEITK